ncbi:MAG: hypothetical protein ABI310_10340 [Microbacteriaceae bacterium]
MSRKVHMEVNHSPLRFVLSSVNSYVVFGLPLHILVNHFVVVLVPLTALAVLLHAFWPAARRRLGVVTALGGVVIVVLVPITISAGRALELKTGVTPAIQLHADLGATLLPWAIALCIISVIEWVWYRFVLAAPVGERMSLLARRASVTIIAGAAVIIAVGSVVDVVLIGDAGARAVWGTLFK